MNSGDIVTSSQNKTVKIWNIILFYNISNIYTNIKLLFIASLLN